MKITDCLGGLTPNGGVCIAKAATKNAACNFYVEFAAGSRDVSYAEHRVGSDIPIWMNCKAEADFFRPLSTAVGRVHADYDGYIEHLFWIIALQHGFNVCVRPTISERSHMPPNEQRLSDAEPKLDEGAAVHGV